MTDDGRDESGKDPSNKREQDRRGEGRRVAERSSSTVRAAIRDELAEDAPEAEQRAAQKKASGDSDAVIELDHVFLAFDSPILEDVSFVARQGETVCIVGESGTGKSTALKLILRLLVPDKGKVLINGEDITGLNFEEALAVRQRMGMVFQGAALFDSMSVFENIAYPLREHTDLDEDEIEARVREKLAFVDLDPDRVMEQLPSELSGGMRKRVGIARGMADNPEIMLYDEPTSGLDPVNADIIDGLVQRLDHELGVTSVMVTHDVRGAFRVADRLALLSEGKIVMQGTPQEFLDSTNQKVREFLERDFDNPSFAA